MMNPKRRKDGSENHPKDHSSIGLTVSFPFALISLVAAFNTNSGD